MSFIAGGFPKRIMNVYWPKRGGAAPILELRIYSAINSIPIPTFSVTGPPVPERALFEARLAGSGYTTETFESYPVATSPSISITQNGSSCLVTNAFYTNIGQPCPGFSTTAVQPFIDDTPVGAYNTTPGGAKFLVAQTYSGSFLVPGCGPIPVQKLNVLFDFSTPIAAFGFYGTDFGDFSPSGITVTIVDTLDNESTYTIFPSTEPPSTLAFWGFVDNRGVLYKQVRVQTTGNIIAPDIGGFDALGFDDIIFCTLPYITN